MATPIPTSAFADRLLDWFDHHGRKDLPWQKNINPYRVWLSEIMLQQTQVATVIPYFLRLIEAFPSVTTLASAPVDEVLHLWTGLGYYARARNLHKAAQIITVEKNGQFPETVDGLCELPGIGRSTAGAIISIAFGKRAAILDGNVKRVLARHHAIEGWPGQTKTHTALWEIAEDNTPQKRYGDYTQAIMDLGATLCTRTKPRCEECPVHHDCKGFTTNNPTQYPGKKPRKKLPVKNTVFLIISNPQGNILLEQRPQTGIWGGLWAFPEISDKKDIHSTCQQQGLKTTAIELKDSIRHTFSHFHLDFIPAYIEVKKPQAIRENPHQRWVNPDDLTGIGLPAPVKKLLTR